jgi:hypothetical protein
MLLVMIGGRLTRGNHFTDFSASGLPRLYVYFYGFVVCLSVSNSCRVSLLRAVLLVIDPSDIL